MRRLAPLVLLVALLSGCASVQFAIEQFPTRTEEMWEDPIRREHFLTQAGLELSTASIVLACAAVVPLPFNLIVCPVVGLVYNFATYEFVLEPISRELVKAGKPSLVGPYWERGPADGEVLECDILVEHCDRWPFILAPVYVP